MVSLEREHCGRPEVHGIHIHVPSRLTDIAPHSGQSVWRRCTGDPADLPAPAAPGQLPASPGVARLVTVDTLRWLYATALLYQPEHQGQHLADCAPCGFIREVRRALALNREQNEE